MGGILTDFFLASPAELAGVNLPGGPRSLPMLPARRVDPEKLAELGAILAGAAWEYPEVVREAGTEGPWVARLPEDLRTGLATLARAPEDDLDALARAWADTDAWREDEGDPEALAAFLRDLASLCDRAVQDDRDVYVWIAT